MNDVLTDTLYIIFLILVIITTIIYFYSELLLIRFKMKDGRKLINCLSKEENMKKFIEWAKINEPKLFDDYYPIKISLIEKFIRENSYER